MEPKRYFWCVCRDDDYTAHGPYDTEEAANAFDDAVEFYMPRGVVSLGMFEAVDASEAVNMAQALEIEQGQPE